MVEGRSKPAGGVMAYRTVCREISGHVIGVGGALKVALVARVTVCGRPIVLPADVATGAGNGSVGPGQGISRQIVIEGSRRPCGGGVTHLALLWKSCRLMIGVGGAVVVLQATGGAHEFEIPIGVAGRAAEGGMNAGQREACKLGMINVRPLPRIHVVAHLAGGWKPCGLLVGQRGLRKGLLMARNAICRRSLKLAHDSFFVTAITSEGRRRSGGWTSRPETGGGARADRGRFAMKHVVARGAGVQLLRSPGSLLVSRAGRI